MYVCRHEEVLTVLVLCEAMASESNDRGVPPTWMFGPAFALLRRPDLWRTSVRVARQHAPPRWWTSRPFLPIPDRSWMSFRYETAFSDTDARPEANDVIDYLEWAKSWQYL